MIEVNNLTKRFGATVAVDHISFSAQQGEVLGFLGPNGAGKTTTMRMLTCYLGADEGTAQIAGCDIHEDPVGVRQHIGYLPESAPLYLDMSVMDSLYFIAQVRGISKSQRQKRIQEMIDVCGLGSVVHKDVGELSKGFRQRLGLAQTLIHDPEVLILDEPTSGLDPNQIIEIRELIKEISREKTIILSTHILPEVSAVCGRVLIINRGKIVADGTPESLSGLASGELLVRTTIQGPQDAIETVLGQQEFIREVRHLPSEREGHHTYDLKVDKDSDATARLFHLAVENQWVLTELHQQTLSLEEVFHQLTTQEVAA